MFGLTSKHFTPSILKTTSLDWLRFQIETSNFRFQANLTCMWMKCNAVKLLTLVSNLENYIIPLGATHLISVIRFPRFSKKLLWKSYCSSVDTDCSIHITTGYHFPFKYLCVLFGAYVWMHSHWINVQNIYCIEVQSSLVHPNVSLLLPIRRSFFFLFFHVLA